jgi:DNA-binding NarL/FixJ family response regulator
MKATPRSGKPLNIALVEDDADLAESIRLILENSDQEIRFVGLAHSAEQALAEFPRIKPDLVLMDLKLPGMQGTECVARLTALLPDVQVVVITVFHDTEAVFESLAAGALGYLTKPVTPGQLIEAVREVRDGGAPMSSAIARRIVQTFHRPGPSSQSRVEEQLSPRELQILRLLSKGCLQKEIADGMQITYNTVRTITKRIYKKLHVHSRAQAVAKYKGDLP